MTTGSPCSTVRSVAFRLSRTIGSYSSITWVRSEPFTVTVDLYKSLIFEGTMIIQDVSGCKMGLQFISAVSVIVEVLLTRWKRLNLLYFLSGWQMSWVNKRTLSPSRAVNGICWSRLLAPRLSAEDGPRCRSPSSRHLSHHLTRTKKSSIENGCFHKIINAGHSLGVETQANAHRLGWGWIRLPANNTNIKIFFSSELKYFPQHRWQNPGSSAWAVFEAPLWSESF